MGCQELRRRWVRPSHWPLHVTREHAASFSRTRAPSGTCTTYYARLLFPFLLRQNPAQETPLIPELVSAAAATAQPGRATQAEQREWDELRCSRKADFAVKENANLIRSGQSDQISLGGGEERNHNFPTLLMMIIYTLLPSKTIILWVTCNGDVLSDQTALPPRVFDNVVRRKGPSPGLEFLVRDTHNGGDFRPRRWAGSFDTRLKSLGATQVRFHEADLRREGSRLEANVAW